MRLTLFLSSLVLFVSSIQALEPASSHTKNILDSVTTQDVPNYDEEKNNACAFHLDVHWDEYSYLIIIVDNKGYVSSRGKIFELVRVSEVTQIITGIPHLIEIFKSDDFSILIDSIETGHSIYGPDLKGNLMVEYKGEKQTEVVSGLCGLDRTIDYD